MRRKIIGLFIVFALLLMNSNLVLAAPKEGEQIPSTYTFYDVLEEQSNQLAQDFKALIEDATLELHEDGTFTMEIAPLNYSYQSFTPAGPNQNEINYSENMNLDSFHIKGDYDLYEGRIYFKTQKYEPYEAYGTKHGKKITTWKPETGLALVGNDPVTKKDWNVRILGQLSVDIDESRENDEANGKEYSMLKILFYLRTSAADDSAGISVGDSITLEVRFKSTDALITAATDPALTEEPETEEDMHDVIVYTQADDKAGETRTGIPPYIPLGALGLGSTAVGLSQILGGGDKKNKKDKNKKDKKKEEVSSFNMVLYKDCGDSLRIGAKARNVGARIEEIRSDGQVIDRPDLTQQIVVQGERNVHVQNVCQQGKYRMAQITAVAGEGGRKHDADIAEAIVSFAFAGPGGVYKNNFIFKMVQDAYMTFPDGNNMDMPDMSQAMGKVDFLFENISEEPSKLTVSDPEVFKMRIERRGELAYSVIAEGYSGPKLPKEGVFGKKKEYSVLITAEFEEGLVLESGVNIAVYPEGFTVLSPPLEGRLVVNSYKVRERNEETLDPEIYSTEFLPAYATVGSDGSAVVLRRNVFSNIGDLQGEDEATSNLLAKYHYDIEDFRANEGYYYISPRDFLSERGRNYFCFFTVRIAQYNVDEKVPVRLLGEPMDPLQPFHDELRKLRDTVIKLYPEDMVPGTLRYIRENYSDPYFTDAVMLRTMRQIIIETSIDYWTMRGEDYRNIAVATSWILSGLEAYKKLGDIAFTILVNYYVGSGADAWLVPCKDFCVEVIGEYLAAYADGTQVEYEKNFKDKCYTILENILLNQISIDSSTQNVKDVNLKTLGVLLLGFILLDYMKNMEAQPEGQKNHWKALQEAFKNLGIQALIKVAGVHIKEYLSSDKVKKFFSGKFVEDLNKMISGSAKGKKFVGNSEDIFESPVMNWDDMYTQMEGNFDKIAVDDSLFNIVNWQTVVESVLNDFFGTGVATVSDAWDEDDQGFKFTLDLTPWGINVDAHISVSLEALVTAFCPAAALYRMFQYIFGKDWKASILPTMTVRDDPYLVRAEINSNHVNKVKWEV